MKLHELELIEGNKYEFGGVVYVVDWSGDLIDESRSRDDITDTFTLSELLQGEFKEIIHAPITFDEAKADCIKNGAIYKRLGEDCGENPILMKRWNDGIILQFKNGCGSCMILNSNTIWKKVD